VIDPVALSRVALLPAVGLVETDARIGEVFYLGQNPNTAGWVLTAFDMATLLPVWAAPLDGIAGNVSRLVRCAPGILAFNTTESQTFILNTARLPQKNEADLEVWFEPAASAGPANSPFTFTASCATMDPLRQSTLSSRAVFHQEPSCWRRAAPAAVVALAAAT